MFKEKIKKWLDRLAEQNKKEFGNRRPNCCDLTSAQLYHDKNRVMAKTNTISES